MNCGNLQNDMMRLLREKLPGRSIKTIEDKGTWIKRIFKVDFEDGGTVYFKLAVQDCSDLMMEAYAVKLLADNGIGLPAVVDVDLSRSVIPYPFIIQEAGEGEPLSRHLSEADPEKLYGIYRAVGAFYGKLAEIGNSWAGLWDTVPGKAKYPVHPAEAMYHLEIEEGAGAKAFSEGVLSAAAYERIKSLWRENLPMLKERPVSLVHYSPFPWTVYISCDNDSFRVSKITALGDILWWDADVMAAHIMYPPFFTINRDLRKAFLEGYGRVTNPGCVRLYAIMHRLCAWAGVYEEPACPANVLWKQQAVEDIHYFMEL